MLFLLIPYKSLSSYFFQFLWTHARARVSYYLGNSCGPGCAPSGRVDGLVVDYYQGGAICISRAWSRSSPCVQTYCPTALIQAQCPSPHLTREAPHSILSSRIGRIGTRDNWSLLERVFWVVKTAGNRETSDRWLTCHCAMRVICCAMRESHVAIIVC